jgi:phosphatidate phosphatase APP1
MHSFAAELESHVDRAAATGLGPRGLIIAPYRGFGRSNELMLRGRVLAEKAITRATSSESVWRNVLNAYRRFQSDEVPRARVRASHRDAVIETVADDEGYFRVLLHPQLIDPEVLWHDVQLELADAPASALGHALVPPVHAEFGVISDIDDTIVETGATSLRQMIRSVILENAATRTAFEGVADLYRLLHRDRNPIFYVSSSPWNLYELLADYMHLHRIPPGPMFLQDYGIDPDTLLHDPHDVHKLREIQSILDYYPALPFVLVGDSGQHDPEIYLRVIQANHRRIRAAFIRDVTPATRHAAVGRIAEEASAAGVEMLYVPDSAEAVQHARRLGLIG